MRLLLLGDSLLDIFSYGIGRVPDELSFKIVHIFSNSKTVQNAYTKHTQSYDKQSKL